MNGCNIAIIGAGTCGLASALFLARDGHSVTIFERFETPQPVGAGLMLQPTGLACLACLGLDEAVIGQSRIIHRLAGETIHGRKVFDLGYSDLAKQAFGLGVHRATLFGTLYEAVRNADVAIHTAFPVQTLPLEAAGRHVVDDAGNQHGPYDLVIDTSGARSQLRATYGNVRYVRPYPYAAVWGVCDQPDDWPWPHTLAQRFDTARHMLGVLPLGQRDTAHTNQMAFFWSMPSDSYEKWKENGISNWQTDIAAYWPAASELAKQFEHVDQLTFATYPDVVLNSYTAERIIFLGDAAHATSPQLGQGANLALADARVFSAALFDAPDLPTTFANYSRVRKRHLRFYQVASRYLTPFFQSDSRAAAATRDALFHPLSRIPYFRREMVRSLAGVKSGLFTSLNPGDWHEKYRL